MPLKRNPLKLNKLQLRTLLLLQELARHPETSTHDPDTGEAMLSTLPHAHGDLVVDLTLKNCTNVQDDLRLYYGKKLSFNLS